MGKFKISLFSLLLFLLCFSIGISRAIAADDAAEFTLEEITVTAAKQGEQNLQKVPLAMDVITGEDFAKNAKANVDDILSNLASVFINTNADGMRVSIRGITDTDPVYGGRKSSSPTVAMNVDGAYNSMNTSGQNLFDVERIEVLMGPQSTLYASNSPGGVVNIITASPKTDKYSASFSALYGNYNHSDLQAVLNAPIVKDKVAARLALNRTRENNFLDPYTDELSVKNDSARLKILWAATDDLDITLTGNYNKNGNRGEMSQQAAPFDKSSSSAWTTASNAQGSNNPLDQITKGGKADISWKTPVGNLTIVPSYSKSDSSGNQTGMVTIGPPGPPGTPGQIQVEGTWYSERKMEQKTAEARIASPADFESLQYVVGFFYYKSEYNTSDTYEGDLSSNDTWNKNNAEQKAIYGNVTYPLPFNDKLSVTAGYRKSWDYAHQIGYQPGRGNDETEMDVSNPDYKLGVQYDMTDQVMLYGSYTSSFRTDSMAMSNNIGVRPPEELKAYTVGAKTRMLNNRVQINASAYYYDYKNKFAQDSGSRGNFTQAELESHTFPSGATFYDGPSGTMVTIPDGTTYWQTIDQGRSNTLPDGSVVYSVDDGGFNGWGDSRTIGADVSLSWVPTSKDLVEFSLSYLDMEWTHLRFIYKYTDFFPDHNYDGRTAPNAPKFSMTASYEHKFDIGTYGILTPRVDMQHRTGFDLVFDQSDGMGYGHQEGYFLWNASLGFNSNSGMWSVNAVVRNITNYAVKKSYMADQQILMLGDPRTYTFTASIKF